MYQNNLFSRILKAFLYCNLILSCSWGFARGHDNQASVDHEFKHHRLAVIIGRGHVFGAEDIENGNTIVTIPTWGIDYQYWINSKFGGGLKSDVEIMNYKIETQEGNSLERNNPMIISTVFLYHPLKGWNFLIGPGVEFEKSHNFFVLRGGMAYEFELPGHWDFAPELVFDLKDGHIGSFTWGIGVGKRF